MILEICVDDLPNLEAAIEGGADRIELCSALALGGLTPSRAMIEAAVERCLPVHAMVRPRGGDFNYDVEEISLMTRDIERCVELGVSGVVVGAAKRDATIDELALARFRDAARGISIALHRVIDLAPDPVAAARIAAKLGYDFILTSGGKLNAFDGRQMISRMVAETSGELSIIAGSGITPENAAAVVEDGNVTEIHASATGAQSWPDRRIEEFGFANGPRRVTDPSRVAALKQAISGLE